jgi:hypothetical protein
MKTIRILLFALGAAFASACDNYDYCHCVDGNWNGNNSATDAICTALGGEIFFNVGLNCNECQWNTDMDNCHWRMFCQLQQSGGEDSWCTSD